jgi:hypothetical protein
MSWLTLDTLVAIKDRKLLREVTPAMMENYLVKRGWVETPSANKSVTARFFTKQGYPFIRIILPERNKKHIDNDMRMETNLGHLEKIEGRSQLRIFDEIVNED